MTPKYNVTRLDSGVRVVSAEMPAMASVTAGIWVGVGSRHESAEVNGICHFIEHLLFKGTKRRTAKDISEAIEGIGGSLNAFTSEELTCFHARASSDRLRDILDVLLDMLFNSQMKSGEVARERAVIKEEIAMYLDEPQHHVHELLNGTMWPDQPLGRPITGTPRSLDSISRDRLFEFLHAHYVGQACVIAAAGNVRHADLVKLVKKHSKHFKHGSPRSISPVEQRQIAYRTHVFSKKTEQTQAALGFRTFSRHDERRYALRLLNVILGENMSSRLFQRIREDKGLVYSIYSCPSFFHDTGDLVVSAGLDIDNLQKMLKLLFAELRAICGTVPSKGDLCRAKDYVLGQMDLAMESTETQMNWVGEQLLGYGRLFTAAEIKSKLSEVTATQITAVARSIFTADRLSAAIIGPLKNASRISRVFDKAFPLF
jgi:predicted Zn-dependent peptidase